LWIFFEASGFINETEIFRTIRMAHGNWLALQLLVLILVLVAHFK
jgi:hypothetical protein